MTTLLSCLCRRDRRLPWFAIVIAIFAANGWFGPAQGAPAVIAATAADDAEIRMDHISVKVIGHGSPVILIPGLSSPRGVWDGVAPDLARRHRVYLVQVNGFGGGDPGANLEPGILDGIVADLHRLIAGRKLEGAALVGHSMGGLVTLMLARDHPGDVGKAMVVDALPFIGTMFAPAATPEAIQPQAQMMRAQMVGLHGRPVPDAVLQAIARQNARKPESQKQVAEWSAKADMRVSGQALYEDMQTDLRTDLGKITVPVTIVVPWTDDRGGEIRTLDLYRAQYAGLKDLKLVGVGDSGHFVMLDQPAGFARALATFLG
ncbi:alpha/beta fold hydrolase [Sphingomonas sp. RS6]